MGHSRDPSRLTPRGERRVRGPPQRDQLTAARPADPRQADDGLVTEVVTGAPGTARTRSDSPGPESASDLRKRGLRRIFADPAEPPLSEFKSHSHRQHPAKSPQFSALRDVAAVLLLAGWSRELWGLVSRGRVDSTTCAAALEQLRRPSVLRRSGGA
jgi:hypothetical protein